MRSRFGPWLGILALVAAMGLPLLHAHAHGDDHRAGSRASEAQDQSRSRRSLPEHEHGRNDCPLCELIGVIGTAVTPVLERVACAIAPATPAGQTRAPKLARGDDRHVSIERARGPPDADPNRRSV